MIQKFELIFIFVLISFIPNEVLCQGGTRIPILRNQNFDEPKVYLLNRQQNKILDIFDIVISEPNKYIIRGSNNLLYRVLFVLKSKKEDLIPQSRSWIFVCLAIEIDSPYYLSMRYFRGEAVEEFTFEDSSKIYFDNRAQLIELESNNRFNEMYWDYQFRNRVIGKEFGASDKTTLISFYLPAYILDHQISKINGTMNLLGPKGVHLNHLTGQFKFSSPLIIYDSNMSIYK